MIAAWETIVREAYTADWLERKHGLRRASINAYGSSNDPVLVLTVRDGSGHTAFAWSRLWRVADPRLQVFLLDRWVCELAELVRVELDEWPYPDEDPPDPL